MLGVELMGEGLEKAAGELMRKILSVLTGNVFKAVVVGTGLTALVQSSSAVTVMVVGFVNAGLMSLAQAMGVIYGANIGTTITVQLMALKLTDYALPILGIGFALNFFSKDTKTKNIGQAIMGFGLMFLGLETLGSGSDYVKGNAAMRQMLITYGNQPLIAIIVGTVFTGIIQASSATIGITMILAQAGVINLTGAIAITLGSNIGTCVTALLACIGTGTNAQRTAIGHILFNIIGSVIFFPFISWSVKYLQMYSLDIGMQIAMFHIVFNIISTILFMPITQQFVKILERLVPGKERVVTFGAQHLDKLLLETPDAALAATIKELLRTGGVAVSMYQDVLNGFFNGDRAKLKHVEEDENLVNALQAEITQYLVELAQHDLSNLQSQQIPALLHIVNDLERIGDHALNVVELAERKIEHQLPFTDQAQNELKQLLSQTDELAKLTMDALAKKDPEAAQRASRMEPVIDATIEEFRLVHVRRLEDGKCRVESGIIYLDILSHFERIADHLRNVADAIQLQLQNHRIDLRENRSNR